MAPFALVDRDKEGVGAVLMILEDMAEAEAIAFELRQRGIKVEVVAAPPDRRHR